MATNIDVLAVMDGAVDSVAYLSRIRKEAGMDLAAGVYLLESKEIAQARAAVAQLMEAITYERACRSFSAGTVGRTILRTDAALAACRGAK